MVREAREKRAAVPTLSSELACTLAAYSSSSSSGMWSTILMSIAASVRAVRIANGARRCSCVETRRSDSRGSGCVSSEITSVLSSPVVPSLPDPPAACRTQVTY